MQLTQRRFMPIRRRCFYLRFVLVGKIRHRGRYYGKDATCARALSPNVLSLLFGLFCNGNGYLFCEQDFVGCEAA